MARHKLSAAKVAKVVVPGRYGDGGGLYLQVSKGADPKDPPKSWLFRFMIAGKAQAMGLGPLSAWTLAEAREEAEKCHRDLKRGINPIDKREAERAAKLAASSKRMTFEEMAKQYITNNRAEWKSAVHAAQWESTLKTYAYPVIGQMDVAAIETKHILDILQSETPKGQLWTTKTETASRVRGRIENILDAAAFAHYRTGENPARWKGHLDKALPRPTKVAKVKRHASLPYAKIGAFMADLRKRDSISARALEFTILTAVRTGETIGAKWNEIDLSNERWIIPEGRMKAGKEHHVPLSPRVIAILKSLPREEGDDNGFVFPGGKKAKPLSNMAMAQMLDGMIGKTATVHGFRSTFREWAGEANAYTPEIIEHALAHQVANQTTASYQRGTQFPPRIRLMADWATYCDRLHPVGDNVVAIAQARA